MEQLTIDAKVENLPQVIEFILAPLEDNCKPKTLMQIELVIEELFVNVASYAYKSEIGKCTICKNLGENPPSITLTFIDSGVPYNPLEKEDPDTTLGVNEREIGGLGIFLVKKNVDEISYEYKDGQNILRLKKYF